MGGRGAPDELDQGHRTQVWLAAGDDQEATVTGQYFFHLRPRKPLAAARDPQIQDALIDACSHLSGVACP
jgi:hypothetical protein